MIPQTVYHLKELEREGQREREREREMERSILDAFFRKSVLCWEKLVGNFLGKLSNKFDYSGTFLTAH